MSEVKYFTVFWRNGTINYLKGSDITDSFNSNGYGAGTLSVVDFYSEGIDINYSWNAETKEWDKKKEITIPSEQAENMQVSDFLNLAKTHSMVQIEYSDKSLLSFQTTVGLYYEQCEKRNTYVPNISICFCEYCNGSYDGNDDTDHHYMVCDGQHFDVDDIEVAVSVFFERMKTPFNSISHMKNMTIDDLIKSGKHFPL